MATTVRLTVLSGPHKNRRLCLCAPTKCLVGRSSDCLVQLSGTERDQLISRHHCQLTIDPPCIQVRDLGSRNGTYINGKRIDLVDPELRKIADWAGIFFRDQVLDEGGYLTVGDTTLKADVVDCRAVRLDSDGKPGWAEGDTIKKDCSQPFCHIVRGRVAAEPIGT